MAGVPYTFANATTSIPLSQLDANFNTTLTLGNTSVGLGNTVTTIGNLTLTNVTISSGTIPTANSIANGTSNVVIASSGGAINIATNGTTAVTIDTSQKVGIGTTSPSSILNVSQSSAADAVIRLNNTNGGVYAANLNIDSSNQTGSRYSSLYSSYGGTYQWSISGGGADSTMAFGTGSSNTERMRISSSGQLIIGRTSAVNAAPLIPSTT